MFWFKKHQDRLTFTPHARLLMSVVAATLLFALALNKVPSSASVNIPYNSNSIWNRPIDTNPAIDPNSSAMIANLVGTTGGIINIDGINGAWSTPIYLADGSTPRQQVCDAGNHSPCETVPIPVGLIPSPDSDGKAVIIDFAANPQRAWSFWQLHRDQKGNWWVNQGAYGYTINTQAGDGIHNHGGGQWGGRVAGWNYLAGLILPQEIAQGHIDHALEMNLPRQVASSSYTWPAFGSDGSASGKSAIPIGAHIQLDPSIDVNSLPLSRSGKIIARALQVYGAWVGDTGSMATFDGQEFVNPNGSIASAAWSGLLTYHALYGGLPMNRLRVVQSNPAEYFQEGQTAQ